MLFNEALQYLEALIDFEKLGATYFGRDRFQLANVRRLLEAVGDPQDGLTITHIAGTKGKGSTAAMLDAILRAHGLRTGLFTKPHFIDIRERTRVDGRMIDGADFGRHVARLKPHIEAINDDRDLAPITFYEAHLALTLLHFAEAEVDAAVIETGLGGRLDATNALTPAACAITRIDYDHTELLGETLEEISREKAGILKPDTPCVFAPQAAEVMEVLQEVARSVGAPATFCPTVTAAAEPDAFTVCGRQEYRGLTLTLPGDHQRENAALAIGLAELLEGSARLTPERVRGGLSTLYWPGRFQVLPGEPRMVLDGAHNPVSARALCEGLRGLLRERPGARLHVVLGMPRDKDIHGFAHALLPTTHRVVCTQSGSARAAPAAAIRDIAVELVGEVLVEEHVPAAVVAARSGAAAKDVVCVTGSFHVVGEAMRMLGVEP